MERQVLKILAAIDQGEVALVVDLVALRIETIKWVRVTCDIVYKLIRQ